MGHPTTSTFASEWATMNHPDGPPPTTTEQPRGSAAYRVQESIRRGDIAINTCPDNIVQFIAVLIGPTLGYDTTLYDDQTQRPTLHVSRKYTRYGTAQPTKPDPTDAGGIRACTWS